MSLPILYPLAKWTPLVEHSAVGTFAQRKQIVLHSTEGTTAAGAIATFKSSVPPHRVSAHFVIDRDGTIYQLVDLRDTAWHASQVNAVSVGIEHVALSAVGAATLNTAHKTTTFQYLPATDEQYASSAELVAWLCQKMGIPCDRQHVREHCEASPADGHVLCCHGAVDPDRIVQTAAKIIEGIIQ